MAHMIEQPDLRGVMLLQQMHVLVPFAFRMSAQNAQATAWGINQKAVERPFTQECGRVRM